MTLVIAMALALAAVAAEPEAVVVAATGDRTKLALAAMAAPWRHRGGGSSGWVLGVALTRTSGLASTLVSPLAIFDHSASQSVDPCGVEVVQWIVRSAGR